MSVEMPTPQYKCEKHEAHDQTLWIQGEAFKENDGKVFCLIDLIEALSGIAEEMEKI